jgi:hypothetical protein
MAPRPSSLPLFTENPRNCLLNPTGLHSGAYALAKRGALRPYCTASCYQKHAIQAYPAIFQTVSEKTLSETRELSPPSGPLTGL